MRLEIASNRLSQLCFRLSLCIEFLISSGAVIISVRFDVLLKHVARINVQSNYADEELL
jgi:hypothetical protein